MYILFALPFFLLFFTFYPIPLGFHQLFNLFIISMTALAVFWCLTFLVMHFVFFLYFFVFLARFTPSLFFGLLDYFFLLLLLL